MPSVQYLREFISERLTAAAEEIFTEFEKTIVQYEEEIDRQRRLLDITRKPEIKLHKTVPPDLPQQHVYKEQQEVLSEQQFCNQEWSSNLDQEEPEPPQIKDEDEELCTSQEGEQLVLETDTFMVTATYEERDHIPNRDQLFSHSTAVAESQNHEGSKTVDSGSSKNSELKTRLHRNRSHINNLEDSPPSKSWSNSDTGKKSLKCDFCGKTFKKKSQMKEHHRSHTGEKPYSCKACGKNFSRSSNLTVHMRTHTGEKPYHCKTCGKRFTHSSSLSVHIRTHTGEKLYPCKICGKALSCTGSLLAHIRTHTGEKPYECKTCGKMFISSKNLLCHSKTHTGQKS